MSMLYQYIFWSGFSGSFHAFAPHYWPTSLNSLPNILQFIYPPKIQVANNTMEDGTNMTMTRDS